MEIKTVGIMGAGAVGSYFLWGMRNLPREDICLIARGGRKERLQKEEMLINEERFLYPVKTPEEAAGVDLLLIATKYGALPGLLEDIKTVVKPQTAVLSLLNGVDSEELIGRAIGEEHMLYSLMRISSERNGNVIFFDPEETRGMWFGEKGIHQITPRAQAVLDLFAKTDCRCTWKEDISPSVHLAGSAGKEAYGDRHVRRSHDTDGEGSGNSRAILRVHISCH